MKKTFLISLFASALFIAGCKKGAEQSLNKPYLLSMDINDNGSSRDTTFYTYDDENRLTTLYLKKQGVKKIFTYNNSDQLVEVDLYSNLFLTSKSVYTYYASGVTEISDFYHVGLPLPDQDNATLGFDTDQQLIKEAHTNGTYDLFTYDAQGNVTSGNTYSLNNLLIQSNSYIYSGGKSTFTNVKGNYTIYFPYTSNYSMSAVTHVFKDYLNPANNSTETFAYEYNSDGWPTKATVTNSLSATISYHYYVYTVK